jgi:hypothetical protein
MPPLVVCELCERVNIEVAGITHFGGYRFEVCADCRTIVSEMRGKIAQFPDAHAPSLGFPNLNGNRSVSQKVDIPADPNKTASISCNRSNSPSERPAFPKCPLCQRRDTIDKVESAFGNRFRCVRCRRFFRTETVGVLGTPVWD